MRQNLAALDLLALRAAQQNADIVARLALVQKLAEHLNARARRLLRLLDADNLDLVADIHDPALDTARHNRAAARNREHVLDRHQERQVLRTVRLRNIVVNRLHQLQDRVLADLVVTALKRRKRRPLHDRNVVARELVGTQKLADLHLHKLKQLLVVTWSTLFMYTTRAGTPTWRASRMCSRVCGIGPSAADTTRIAPSICAAPVIMFFT